MNPRRLWRALRSRIGATGLVGVVAACTVAAAMAGPSYYAAARESVLHDAFGTAITVAKGAQVTGTGPVGGDEVQLLSDALVGALASGADGGTAERRLFSEPILSTESSLFLRRLGQQIPLVDRTGFCQHLQMVSGRCATEEDDVVVAVSLAELNGWRVGTTVRASSWQPLHVVGIYRPADLDSTYWFAHETKYFPIERPTVIDITAPPTYDAIFTPVATMQRGGVQHQGTYRAAVLLREQSLDPTDVDSLRAVAVHLSQDRAVRELRSTAQTEIPTVVDRVRESWRSLAVPITIVTAELILLAWLLLFLLVTTIADARTAEVALARLRGQGALRIVAVAVGEPVALLVAALPVGAVLGWAAATLLGHASLRAGTATPPTAMLGWAAAAVATLGGIVAAALAARRALRADLVGSLHTSRSAARTGWALDAVVLTAAAAGFAQLAFTGAVTSSEHGGVVLLVPALLVLAAAVVASRLLPLICRSLYRAGNPVAIFLLLRAVARRPGGTRSVMLLATATGLLTFAVASWSVGDRNRNDVAAAAIGAPRVLTVTTPADVDLAEAVERADPDGAQAAAVDVYDNGEVRLLAVQPARFAAVADWGAAREARPSSEVTERLHPAAGKPMSVDGDRVRVELSVDRLTSAADVTVEVLTPTSGAPTPVRVGAVDARSGTVRLSGELPGCPCRITAVLVTPPPGGGITGLVAVRSVAAGGPGPWQDVDGATDPQRWRSGNDSGEQHLTSASGALLWQFSEPVGASAEIRVADHPEPLPALVSSTLPAQPSTVTGLDAGTLAVTAVARPHSIPGAGAEGVVVARDYALLAARSSDFADVSHQIWLSGNNVDNVLEGLRAEHVRILTDQDAATRAAEFGREGPGLAALLFLLDAAVATTLAALGAVAALWSDARRRRYEYAALLANRIRRRTVTTAVVGEQLLTLLFATVVGVTVGYAASIAVLPNVPEFITQPDVQLDFTPPFAPMLAMIGTAVAAVAAVGALAGWLLVRRLRPDLLREGAG